MSVITQAKCLYMSAKSQFVFIKLVLQRTSAVMFLEMHIAMLEFNFHSNSVLNVCCRALVQIRGVSQRSSSISERCLVQKRVSRCLMSWKRSVITCTMTFPSLHMRHSCHGNYKCSVLCQFSSLQVVKTVISDKVNLYSVTVFWC